MVSTQKADTPTPRAPTASTSTSDMTSHRSQRCLRRRSGFGRRERSVGFDPTADSLHVGSLLPLLALRRAQLAGHRPLVLIGGGTGLIGDPSGKVGERQLNPEEQVAEWAAGLKAQVRRFLDFESGPSAAILVDNYEWLSKL